jgi:hypothetical protein
VWKKQHPERTHGGARKGGELQDSPKEFWTDAIVEQTGWSGGTLARLANIGAEIDTKAAGLLFGTPTSNIQKELIELIHYGPIIQRQIAGLIADGSVKTVAQGAVKATDAAPVGPVFIEPEKQVKKVYSAFEKMTDDAKMLFANLLKSEGYL